MYQLVVESEQGVVTDEIQAPNPSDNTHLRII